MSDAPNANEGFLRRWARRKRAAATGGPGGAKSTSPAQPPADRPGPLGTDDRVDLSADFAALPPIESITATSNIHGFLGPGVPESLRRAALRRAWASDPAIRDFVGIAENQWNFNDPDGIPGFGSLEWTPQLRRMVADLVGEPAERTPRIETETGAKDAETPGAAPQRLVTQAFEQPVQIAAGPYARLDPAGDGNAAEARTPDLTPVAAPANSKIIGRPKAGQPHVPSPRPQARHGKALPR
jgi:hypothetical protein